MEPSLWRRRSASMAQRSKTARSAHPSPPKRTGWLSPQRADAIVGVTILVVAAVLVARLDDPLGVRADSWSEAEVIISGINYATGGFFSHAALPQHQVGPPVDPYFLYANYPVLSNLLYGALHKLGADAYGLYRLPAIAASLVAVWLWYRLVTRVVDHATGVAAAVALASSFGFLAYADNIHQQAYPMAPQFGALLCVVIGIAPRTTRRWKWLLGGGLCLLLLALLTVELHLWMLIALFGYALLFGSAVRRRWLLLFVLPLCAGIALQWLQGRAGSPVAPAERPGFTENLYRRSLGFAAAVDTPVDASGQKVSLATYPAFVVASFHEFYRVPVWLLPVLVVFGLAGAGRLRWGPATWPPQMRLLLVLFAAALGWMGTMMQQTAVHPATMRQLLPFYGLLLGIVWVQALCIVFDTRKNLLWRAGALLIGASALIPHCRATWSNMQMHLNHQYRHEAVKEPGWAESLDLRPLRALPEKTVILTNYGRAPLIRYWSRRPTYLAPNAVPPGLTEESNWMELTLNYLRGLYHDDVPHLLYLYHVMPPTSEHIRLQLVYDPLLRMLTTGHPEPLTSPEAENRAIQAFRGDAPSACPILVYGRSWRCFDMTPIQAELLRAVTHFGIPSLKEMPPPR
jgi:4-amino-4-deoxy-L-arabinose transferase-like glycosyltransferase